ncbi:YceD family protein [Noviherbaspirillum massiliense]|uniref:YceD family protein n=1 Tax=Noviherbaspirillum massiliense TaxID=1465823 RepID=UPI0002E57A7D|nr:DUF177 domain-containing protein [Noviherbaspirillum massiliense]
MNALVIDAFEFCRLKERLEGETLVADLPRLAKESVDRSGRIMWSLQGGTNSEGHAQLILDVSGTVRLLCQRCLTPLDFNIASKSMLLLAKDEASADELDASLDDDDASEVIVGSKAFNVADLIEDEALLALPQAPKHEACSGQPIQNAPEEMEKVSPFAVLKKLRQ